MTNHGQPAPNSLEPSETPQPTANDNISELSAVHQLASSKISTSFSQGDESVDNLGNAITAIANHVHAMQCESDEALEIVQLKKLTNHYAETITSQVNEAVTALQFYDLLSQQMEKVRGAVNELGLLLAQPAQSIGSEPWLNQLISVHQKLTEESGGSTVDTTGSTHARSAGQANDASNCELF